MPSLQRPFVSIALGRLRRGVLVCCWVIAASITTQLLIWCVATFMDVRYEILQEKKASALILSGEQAVAHPAQQAIMNASRASQTASENLTTPIDANRVATKHDVRMAKAAALAMGAGTLAIIVLIPLLAMGVLLGAGTATPGVESTISAFIWSLMVAVLVLPMGERLGMPWREGALTSYQYMTQQVELELSNDPARWGSFQFYSRFAVLPLACLVGVTIIGLRFCFGVGAGMLPKEDMRLDPKLEKEAANITPSSLHGGRAGAALRAANAASVAEKKFAAPITNPSAGEVPRRLI